MNSSNNETKERQQIMTTVYYLDGEEIGVKKAKQVLDHFALKHNCQDDAESYWKRKTKDEDAREQINNITESMLEIFIED